jgi:transposase
MPAAAVSFAGDLTDGGIARARFWVAVSGRRDQEASFFTVVVWRDQAEHAAQSLAKRTFRNGLRGLGWCWMLLAMTSLVDRLLPDGLWQRIQPLLPPAPARPRGGVPRRVPDRNCAAALVFMARTSTPWSLLPAKELGCGSTTSCWRRLDEWAKAGVFEQLQAVLLDELGEAGRIDLERVSVDSFSLRAVKGGPDRRQSGRSRQGRVQAAPGRRRWWAAAVGGGECGQRQRLDHVGGGTG